MRTLTANSTSGIANLIGPRLLLTLLLLAAAATTITVHTVTHTDDSLITMAVAQTDDSLPAAAHVTAVTISTSDGLSDAAASAEITAPGTTRIFMSNMLSAPVLILMILVFAVFTYRKKLSRQGGPNAN